MRAILNNKIVVWALLAVPGAGMVLEVRGGALAMDQTEPSGRWAVWLLLVAISAGPLLDLIGPRAVIQWLVRMRRSFGVAAFGYAALHLGFYSMDIGALDEMTRSKLNSDLLNLWQQKRWTVVFVTHNIYEAVYLSNRVIVMAPRPGRVVADVAIEAPYPRTEDFRSSSFYNDQCRKVSAALASASAPRPPAVSYDKPI